MTNNTATLPDLTVLTTAKLNQPNGPAGLDGNGNLLGPIYVRTNTDASNKAITTPTAMTAAGVFELAYSSDIKAIRAIGATVDIGVIGCAQVAIDLVNYNVLLTPVPGSATSFKAGQTGVYVTDTRAGSAANSSTFQIPTPTFVGQRYTLTINRGANATFPVPLSIVAQSSLIFPQEMIDQTAAATAPTTDTDGDPSPSDLRGLDLTTGTTVYSAPNTTAGRIISFDLVAIRHPVAPSSPTSPFFSWAVLFTTITRAERLAWACQNYMVPAP